MIQLLFHRPYLLLISLFFVRITLLSPYSYTTAQTHYPFGFQRSLTMPVFNSSADTLIYAWAGGINSVRFSEIDLNMDGLLDLFLFEKHGNRILTFLNQGAGTNYLFAPHFAHHFPKLHDWAILADYDQDGKADIFTYGLAGISVYRNSDDYSLEFELVDDQLTSFYYNGYSNIYASPDDYIVIDDIDNDGDLDILNFWILGKYVHFQRNYTVENGSNPLLFDFKLEDECWGHFEEGADNNVIQLNSNCNSKEINENNRHVGSSMCLYDFNNNGVKDLILGDIDYPNLILLENGGSNSNALITSQDHNFPNSNCPIQLFSLPTINFIDVNHDSVKEIIASPSDPSLTKSQDHNSVWLYSYSSDLQKFVLESTHFLQDEMIDVGSGAYPFFIDFNQDQLTDLIIANYGKYDSSNYNNSFLNSFYSSSLSYYQNVGTATAPRFLLITDDLFHLKQYNYQALYPAFGDIDQDGNIDILFGHKDGTISLLEDSILTALNIDVGDYSTPQLFDIDQDGKLDLLIGTRRGHIVYYHNQSTPGNISFELVNTTFGNVDVRDYSISYFGYATPLFFRKDNGETVLFCGNEQGKISYYTHIDQNIDGTFDLEENSIFELYNNKPIAIAEGIRIGIAMSDLNQDGWPDMVIGNWAGGLSLFEGVMPPPITINIANNQPKNPISIYPNPATNFINLTAQSPINHISITNMLGIIVLEQSVDNLQTITLQLDLLSPGAYFIQCNTSGGLYSKLFVKIER